jgi:capsular polysaccharide biosynthesis protein
VPAEKPFQAETLRMLDVPVRGCVDPRQFPVVHARELVAPFHEVVGGMTHPGWVVRFLREQLLPSRAAESGPPQRRLYITRAGARWRRVTNEDEVMRVLEPLGFRRVSLDHLTVADQMRLFHEAEVVVAPHGAALANLAFARPGTKVVEFQPRKIQDVFFRLCQAAGLEYRYLTSLTGPENAVNNQQQIDIAPEALVATLAELEVR